MKEEIGSVASDVEGTAANLEPTHFKSWLHIANNDLSLNFSSVEDLVEKIPRAIGGGGLVVAQGLASLAGLKDPDAPWQIAKKEKIIFGKALKSAEKIETRPGYIEVLEKIKKLGLSLTVGSMTEAVLAWMIIEKSNMKEFFSRDQAVFFEDVENIKPAPDVWLKTAKISGVKPINQLGLEDSATGMTSLRAAGSRGIVVPVFRFGQNLTAIWNAGPARIFFDWTEVDIEAVINNISNEEIEIEK